jgi:MFS family permease
MRVRGRSIARRTFHSLGNPAYRRFWISLIILMAGVNMQMMARGQLSWDLTKDTFQVALVGSAFAPPILIFAVFGGAFADRWDRKKMIQYSQLAICIIAGSVGVAILTEKISIWILILAGFAQGMGWSFMMPARQAIIPEIVGQKNLTNGLALNAAGMSAMTLVSPAVAGFLYARFEAQGVYVVITALGVLAIASTTLVRYDGSSTVRANVPMLADIRDGLRVIAGHHLVLVLIIMGLTTTLLAMPFRFLIPVFVVEIYGRGPEELGLLVSIMGLGSLTGAVFIASLGKWKRGLLLISGSFMSGIGLLLVSAFPYYMAGAAIMVLLGLGDATRRTLNQTLILEVVEDQYRGRVMSVFMMNFGLMPLGVLPASLAIEALGGQMAVAILGFGMIAVTSVIILTQKRLREFE